MIIGSNITLEKVNDKDGKMPILSHTRRERKFLKAFVKLIIPSIIITSIIILSDFLLNNCSNFTNIKNIFIVIIISFISSALIDVWVRKMSKALELPPFDNMKN